MRKPSQTTVTAFGGIVTALLAVTVIAGVSAAPAATETYPDQIAEQFGVTVVVVEDLTCGNVSSAAGCFRTETPDVVYLDKREGTSWQRSVILHELGHVMQHRLGQPLDECKADQFALSLGATWTGNNCPTGAN
jgi:hypothetical protein